MISAHGAHNDAFVIFPPGGEGAFFTNTASYCSQAMVDFSKESGLKQGEVLLFEMVLNDFDCEAPKTLPPDLWPFRCLDFAKNISKVC